MFTLLRVVNTSDIGSRVANSIQISRSLAKLSKMYGLNDHLFSAAVPDAEHATIALKESEVAAKSLISRFQLHHDSLCPQLTHETRPGAFISVDDLHTLPPLFMDMEIWYEASFGVLYTALEARRKLHFNICQAVSLLIGAPPEVQSLCEEVWGTGVSKPKEEVPVFKDHSDEL